MASKFSKKSTPRTVHDISLGRAKQYRPDQRLSKENTVAPRLLRECAFPATSVLIRARTTRRSASRVDRSLPPDGGDPPLTLRGVWRASTSGARLTEEEARHEIRRVALAITVFIRYQLDPFKRAMFEQYAARELAIIPDAAEV